MLFYLGFGWNVDGQIGVIDHQQAPQATPLLVSSKDAGLACWIKNCVNVTPCKKLLYKPILSLELSKLVLEIHRQS
jgi:hypothetical protein